MTKTLTDADMGGGPIAKAPRQRHPCAGRKKNGKECGIVNTLPCKDGSWKCRHHRADTDVLHAPPAARPPVTVMRTKSDAERMASWITTMLATGRMQASAGAAALRGVSMWCKTQERAEQEILDAFKALLEKQRPLAKLLVKAREAYEDNDAERGETLVGKVEELGTELKAELQRIAAKQEEREAKYNG